MKTIPKRKTTTKIKMISQLIKLIVETFYFMHQNNPMKRERAMAIEWIFVKQNCDFETKNMLATS